MHKRRNSGTRRYCYEMGNSFHTVTWNRKHGKNITIRKTCPCNEYPLKPHFYIVKLGYAGVYLFFLFLLQNIDCGYSLEPPRRGGSNEYPQSMFWRGAVLTCTHNLCFEQKKEKYQNFFDENFNFYNLKKSLYIAWASFRKNITITGS